MNRDYFGFVFVLELAFQAVRTLYNVLHSLNALIRDVLYPFQHWLHEVKDVWALQGIMTIKKC